MDLRGCRMSWSSSCAYDRKCTNSICSNSYGVKKFSNSKSNSTLCDIIVRVSPQMIQPPTSPTTKLRQSTDTCFTKQAQHYRLACGGCNSNSRLLVDVSLEVHVPLKEFLRLEPQVNLALGRLLGVRTVDDVSADINAEVCSRKKQRWVC